MIPGYWHNEEATERTLPGGRLHTGDVAVIDDEGWVYLVDRIKDQINTSGYKVWPREVEDVLCEHPSVLEAAVVGVPDDEWGQRIEAAVVAREGCSIDAEALREYIRGHLRGSKTPDRIHVISELPRTETGKLIRRHVVTAIAGESATADA